MCELTLEADGYHADEARVSRRIHGLLQQPQDPTAPLPAWLTRSAPWGGYVDCLPNPEAIWPDRWRELLADAGCRREPFRPAFDPRALPAANTGENE